MTPLRQRCIVVTAAGGLEVLWMEEANVADPGPAQVRIRVEAAGVNRHACNQRARGPTTAHSNVPGLEVAGRIDAVGPDVAGLAIGDAV